LIRLAKYYGPWLGAILLAIGLLFAQANLDLALPDYLSRIINTGIQQGGIETPIPDQMRSSSWEAILSMIPGEGSGDERLRTLYVSDGAAEGTVKLNPVTAALMEEQPELRKAFLNQFVAYGLRDAMMSGDDLGFGDAPLPGDGPGAGADAPDPRAMVQMVLEDDFLREQLAVRLVAREYELLGIDTAAVQNQYIWRIGGIMLLLTLLSAAATISVSFIGARVSAGVARTLRGELFRKVESFSAAEIDRFSTASLITRSTNDITQVQMVTFLIIRMVFLAPIMGIGGVIRAMGKAPNMAWLIGLAVLVLLGLVMLVVVIVLPRFKLIQKLTDSLNRVGREQLSGIMVIRAFNRQGFEEDRFDGANKELTSTNLFVGRTMATLMPLIWLIMNTLIIAIIWVGAGQVASFSMAIGDLMAFMQYAMQIVMSFLMLTMVFIILPRASVSARRIAEVLETEPSIVDPKAPVDLTATIPAAGSAAISGPPLPSGGRRGVLEFRDVSFAYPGADENALCGISFTAEPGKTTAIIGSTGSGKSSLVNLIPRFYDVSGGSILLDGVDIREMSQKDLREQIGYVPQQSSLFTGTIESNLRYGDENADRDRMRRAAEVAQALGFIEEREGGLESEVSQGGVNVSGGQRQRLSIARAIIGKPPVLIFDDSFSALDFRTDAALRRALDEYAGDATRIIVAQRVSTILRAEQIIVLEDGNIAGIGTHRELMESCGEYREIVLSQLSIEEAS
jgi:ATP-binding cassette subfamily B multidrug efflux pump